MTPAPEKAFFRPGKMVLLLLLGVLVYGLVLVVHVPAGWLWQKASARIPLPADVAVKRVSGTVWSGAAAAVVAGYPLQLEWQLGTPSVSGLSLPADFSVVSSGSAVDGRATIDLQGDGTLQASGRLAVADFEELIRRSGGAVIEGDVIIERLALSWQDGAINSADGTGRWAGGQVTWPMGGQVGRAEFPPMGATLDNTADGVVLVIAQQGGDGPAAEAELHWDGMMDLRVYKRMVDLAGQPWPDSAAAGDVIFRVRQTLAPGNAL